MVIAAMELRRLGMANKPMIVVPNHMLEQFCTEWRALYPLAKVLFPSEAEQGPEGRKRFVARAAVGNWDAVVVTESVFERIPLSPRTEAAFIDRQVEQLRHASGHFQGEIGRRSRTVKDLELRVLKLTHRSRELLHRADKDDGATFEQTGVDYLFIDEAQHAKNLAITTRMPALGKTGSGYASQLDIRLDWLRSKYGPKVLTLSTATPIANSLSEMWVMQHYAAPDTLTAAGVAHFDAWASNFAGQVTRLELAPEGTHYRIATRLAKYRNVPDLIRMFSTFADVRTKADLDLPVPALRHSRPEVVVVPGSDDLANYVATLGARAEAVRSRAVAPEDDNMLKISSDGRAAALDVRLVDLDAPPGDTKLTVAADRIHTIWTANRDNRYRDPSGNDAARPGALQLVFCELGTPGGARWGLYDELRRLLIERGMPPASVRFAHEARNAREKEQLFAACRNGSVAVLVGTTEKMGVGTNVQARCIALHHLDCPWRPADVEQREGRILRQGNQHDIVHVIRYVTAGSFDVYMWQAVEMKAGFIHQVLDGRVGSRNLDDVASDQELSYAEVKALATGDDRIVRKAGLEADVARMRRQRSAHFEDQTRLQRTITRNQNRHSQLTARAARLKGLVARLVDTRSDRFAMTVEDTAYRERGPAGTHLLSIVEQAMRTARNDCSVDRDVAQLGGISWRTQCRPSAPDLVEVDIAGTPIQFSIEQADLRKIDPSRLVQRLENGVGKLPGALADTHHELDTLATETKAAQQRLTCGFPGQHALGTLEAELAVLNAELIADGHDDQRPTRPAADRGRSQP